MARRAARPDAPQRPQERRSAVSGQKTGSEAMEALSALSERAFQAMVVAGLRERGWLVWVVPNMRMTAAGLPDVVAVHPDRDVCLFWELKTQRGRVRPAQTVALAALARVPGIDARILRPTDWAELSREV